MRLTASGAVVSHLSAVVLHGLPVATNYLGPVQVTRPSIRGGKKRRSVHAHVAALGDEDVVTIGGIATTSLARTVADLGRSQPFRFAVMAGDGARRSGLSSESFQLAVDRAAGWPRVAAPGASWPLWTR